ncbi:MAG: LacI family DNA-binding transcriptional regulator [Opitutales bacterium]|nr:LacI family DNA-binding transcriptional regulator [Opitutales bacterium]
MPDSPNSGNKRVTLADIAKADGTHVTTVSLALRNSSRLPEATRKRIQALAEKMGYTPDPMLHALVSYRERTRKREMPTQVIAYVTNWTTRWGWKNVTAHPDFYEGARKAAEQLGYKLEHFWLREPGLSHGHLSHILESRGIQGLIIASHTREIDDSLMFDWEHFSAVKIDFFPHYPELHNVTNNQCSIIRLAMRRIMQSGYRKIGFVMHRGWDHSVDHMWSAGFLVEQQLIEEAERIPMFLFPEPEPISAWFNESKGEVFPSPEAFKEWYEKWKPEVIVSRSGFVLPIMSEMGIRIPQDVAFVDLFLEDTSGQLAGVRQNYEQVGASALEILAGQLSQNKRGIPKIPTATYVEGTWSDGLSMPEKPSSTRRNS